MDRLFMFLATGGYSGYLPKAPGTWGSLVGVLLWSVLCHFPLAIYLTVTGLLFLAGVASAGAAEKIVDRGDPGLVVIDEIVGQLLTLCMAPFGIFPALAGFALFRLFDIMKPFPVNWFDSHLHGGLGIMLDDVIAGLYGLLVFALGMWILG